MSSGKQKRSTVTFAKLRDATIELIVEQGWHEATSRKVADRAGVSLGVVHYHVDSITELRRRSALWLIEQYFLRVAAEVTTIEDPAEAVHTLFGQLADGNVRDEELSVLYQALVASTFDEELQGAQAEMLAMYRGVVTDLLSDRGVSRAAAVAATIVAAADGYLLHRALDPHLDPQPVIDGLVSLINANRAS